MKHLWDNYKNTLFSIFPDLEYRETWARWEGKDTSLIAKTYSNDYFIKAREVDILSDKSSIYNNIIYPKTGSNLPCFGMDLMGFFEKKIIIVFDFQHPKEKYPFSKYKEMVELEKPTGMNTSEYKDFDAYMTKLDPVAGYLSGKFGKDKAESLVNDFLFTYG